MLIKKHSIQNLVESISLSEHLRRYIDLKRSGGNWLGLCPFHQDSTPSFYVYPTNYHCFACNAHGSILNYEMHRTGLSFKECVEQLAQTYQYSIEYESSEQEEKKVQQLQKQNEQIAVLKKIQMREPVEKFSAQEIQVIQSFHYSSYELKENLFFMQYSAISPLEKENGELYGLVFLNSTTQIPLYVTVNKNFAPCLNWNEARVHAIKEKYLVVTCNLLDSKFFYEKNIHNVVTCLAEIDIYLLKLFSRRVKNIILVIPDNEKGKLFLWQTFLNAVSYENISVDVLLTHAEREKRNIFFSTMTEEKIKIWLKNSEKIHIKVTQLFLDSLPKEKNRQESFKQKILPVINKIQEPSIKKALLADIANKFFYASDITKVPYQPYNSNSVTQNSNLITNEDLIELIAKTVNFYHKFLLHSKNFSSEAMDYLASRRLTVENLERWKIGFCPSGNELSKKAQTGIVSQENLQLLGVIKKPRSGGNHYDFFRDRIIIPIPNHKGEFVALSGRILPTKNENGVPKYVNSPESDIFSKSKILFNFYRALDAIIINKYVIVVEGYMDCISLVDAGIENVVAVMGTALTKFHLNELTQITKRIILCFDNDKAGQSAAKRTFAAAVNFQNVDLEYLSLPECKDPDEYIKRFGKEEFLKIAQNKNALLYEKISEWCHSESRDNQEFVIHIQKEFECLIDSQNDLLVKQVGNYLLDKYNVNLRSFFSARPSQEDKKTSQIESTLLREYDLNWPVKTPIELKLLFSLLFLKFSELPERLQNIMLAQTSENENDEQICAQAIENQFSKTGFRVFLEISAWMAENNHISLHSFGSESAPLFSQEAQILIGFALSDIKILLRFHLHELIKESLSSGISMVLSENVWNLKNTGFLKFLLRNIMLAFQNGVLQNLFAEALLNLEVDYIDCTLKAHSSLHFDNDLDAQFQFLVAERVRRKMKLGSLDFK
ncbi:MAG: toprim domain-containing protein [Bdellovibrionota bacterium]